MNWKKILVFTLTAGLAGGINPWLQAATSGHPIPFTFGTVGVPALTTLIGTLAGLFAKQPQQP